MASSFQDMQDNVSGAALTPSYDNKQKAESVKAFENVKRLIEGNKNYKRDINGLPQGGVSISPLPDLTKGENDGRTYYEYQEIIPLRDPEDEFGYRARYEREIGKITLSISPETRGDVYRHNGLQITRIDKEEYGITEGNIMKAPFVPDHRNRRRV